ncbi:uncharacterized protein Dana_GF26983, partial [Drosophila ananassae]
MRRTGAAKRCGGTDAEKETPKRARNPSSSSVPQRATPAKKTRATSSCKTHEKQEGLSGTLISQIDEGQPGLTSVAICSRCGQQDVPKADKQAQTLPIRRKKISVLTEPWRRLSQDSTKTHLQDEQRAPAQALRTSARLGPFQRTPLQKQVRDGKWELRDLHPLVKEGDIYEAMVKKFSLAGDSVLIRACEEAQGPLKLPSSDFQERKRRR